ncbi:hypothetical protein PVAG01_05843 [Phlyctema vagabunda]|uniref:Uncharacterized protein n=1 Tax=Phlyctema vagabunda TaxID=108571 RepID=A0ABR4PEY5_9HELO
MGNLIPNAVAQKDPSRSSLIIRGFRVIRKSLEDDGVVGRVTESWLSQTLMNLLMVWLVIREMLWIVVRALGHYYGEYTRNPFSQMMKDMFHQKNMHDYLIEGLLSPPIWYLERIFSVFWVVNFLLGASYWVLEKFTLEEHEVAQREYEEAKKLLGDTGDEEEEENQRGLLDGLVDHYLFRYAFKGLILWNVLMAVGEFGTAAYEDFQAASEAANAIPVDLSPVNPYRRDFPSSQDGVLREVVYMDHVLRDLTPTTIPGDDYELFSNMLQSLATRTDLSWRVYEETDICRTIMAAANRRESHKEPIADEPLSIKARVKALHAHWQDLGVAPGKPERWEEASDTTMMRPLLQGRSIEIEDQQVPFQHGGHRLILTPEQAMEADRVYRTWRRTRDREAAYLKDHPPNPIGWVQVPKAHPSDRGAWESLFEDGKVDVGRSVPNSKLVGNRAWKPIYGTFHYIPYNWRAPGETEGEVVDWDSVNFSLDQQKARRTLQTQYLKELEIEAERVHVKKEL